MRVIIAKNNEKKKQKNLYHIHTIQRWNKVFIWKFFVKHFELQIKKKYKQKFKKKRTKKLSTSEIDFVIIKNIRNIFKIMTIQRRNEFYIVWRSVIIFSMKANVYTFSRFGNLYFSRAHCLLSLWFSICKNNFAFCLRTWW